MSIVLALLFLPLNTAVVGNLRKIKARESDQLSETWRRLNHTYHFNHGASTECHFLP